MSLRKIFIYINILVLFLLLAGCEMAARWTPKIIYRPTIYKSDNRTIEIEDGYKLNSGHSYDIEWTDDGYDLIFHFTVEQEKENIENYRE